MSPLRGWGILQGSATGGSASLTPGYPMQPLRDRKLARLSESRDPPPRRLPAPVVPSRLPYQVFGLWFRPVGSVPSRVPSRLPWGQVFGLWSRPVGSGLRSLVPSRGVRSSVFGPVPWDRSRPVRVPWVIRVPWGLRVPWGQVFVFGVGSVPWVFVVQTRQPGPKAKDVTPHRHLGPKGTAPTGSKGYWPAPF
jgi:hypothetical protein